MLSTASAARGSDYPNFPNRCEDFLNDWIGDRDLDLPVDAISRTRLRLSPNTKPER